MYAFLIHHIMVAEYFFDCCILQFFGLKQNLIFGATGKKVNSYSTICAHNRLRKQIIMQNVSVSFATHLLVLEKGIKSFVRPMTKMTRFVNCFSLSMRSRIPFS